MTLWILFGAGAFGLSAFLWLATGSSELERTESALLGEETEEGWEREFFGIQVRFRSGQITLFKEKEEKVSY